MVVDIYNLRPAELKFEANLGYRVKTCSKYASTQARRHAGTHVRTYALTQARTHASMPAIQGMRIIHANDADGWLGLTQKEENEG